MTYQQALQFLDSFLNYEKISPRNYPGEFTLERIKGLLGRLGDPHRRHTVFHVAGTKGKGSTCAIAARLLSACGYRTGLYTSPHLLSIRERFQIDGEPISEEEFAGAVDAVRPMTTPDMTFFEVTTACAFLHFFRRGVDAAVIEVGMGGRLDSTNLVSPAVTAIAPVSLDHTAQLGSSVAQIATEKAGIIKEGVPVVVGIQPEEVLSVIARIAAEKKAPLHRIDREVELLRWESDLEGNRFSFVTPAGRYEDLCLPLLGRHQIDNALVAVRMTQLWPPAAARLSPEVVQRGMAAVRWPGRCQLIKANRLFLLDGAHNADSAFTLRETVRTLFPGRRIHLILGTSAGKDHQGILDVFAGLGWNLVVTQAGVPRAEPAGRLAALVKSLWGRDVPVTASVREAVSFVDHHAGREDLAVVTGSLFVVADALKILTACGETAFQEKEIRR
ncbi:MAG: bifunctional folylpolyglutamate synthase/dihydrofolate synthase [Candidatus Omnitrophica bacterium]|nr:bifunctional folylpolyglutamate synthase/dihydrofolate synthase [Candidatus Omnitrophota bacterium]